MKARRTRPLPGGAKAPSPNSPPPDGRFVGIDIGAETLKLVELIAAGGALRPGRRQLVEHHKEPLRHLVDCLRLWDWPQVRAAAVTGRLARQVRLPRIPTKHAQAVAFRDRFGDQPALVVAIGSRGFSVLERRASGVEVLRENSRCSQGTGNFLRQLVERFELTLDEANQLSADVADPVPLSGRCPVILKTDMTHLANRGESRPRILAGLFDAVCENVLALVKPRPGITRALLVGGVSRSARVQAFFRRALGERGLEVLRFPDPDDALFLEASGAALCAVESASPVTPLDRLVLDSDRGRLPVLPDLAASLPLVQRLPAPGLPPASLEPCEVVLGFDIGSTGSKAVVTHATSREMLWQAYTQTAGSPVVAAQNLLRQFTEGPVRHHRILSFGVTGSGREIVGSLLATCYGGDRVFILNEIAAHAEGALQYDARVDTIFEIGGQDAKYIRLEDGHVVDCAMNEACSAGTGSFIEEQGRKFAGIGSVRELGQIALQARETVSLGQHCSVFMAEVIDEAVGAGLPQPAIIAGLYDSVIQNYLNRVKGTRSVGKVIFCQGMPFSSDALAAAVARHTGSRVVVPPHPGTVGALGIALLTLKAGLPATREPLLPDRFLEASLEAKDTFVCRSTRGCGGAGNRCRIDQIRTVVSGQRQQFTWGGGCSLHDRGVRKRKLPDRAPDPFREREALVQGIAQACRREGAPRRVMISDEFLLKDLYPFFATFLHGLGLDVVTAADAGTAALKRGVQQANVPWCAPMQLFHGLVSGLPVEENTYVFLPMLRELPHAACEPAAVTCPLVQAAPDLLRWDFASKWNGQMLSPVLDPGDGMESERFREGCRGLATSLGCDGPTCDRALQQACEVQRRFEADCQSLGQKALAFCAEHTIDAVVVLGRPYTIHNPVLNSNVPALLREQGALAIPVDCYPVEAQVPSFPVVYWGYAQRILRAAHQVRRATGVYAVYCSNYSCGPDSFSLHFFAYIMEGKPFAVIETDGHSGDAGTKTRLEAFLHCVRTGCRSQAADDAHVFNQSGFSPESIAGLRQSGEPLLVPWIGPASRIMAAGLQGMRLNVVSLPPPDEAALKLGRRHTSGKECLPMCLTVGNLLKHLETMGEPERQAVLLMPRTLGPCRYGVYNLLNEIILERFGWRDRLRIWSPAESGYFDDLPAGSRLRILAALCGADLLLEALLEARPGERRPGAAQAIYDRAMNDLLALVGRVSEAEPSLARALWVAEAGDLFGVIPLLRRAAGEFAAIRGEESRPRVLVLGEIYVRCDPFANRFIIEELERRGLRTQLSPFSEMLEYTEWLEWDHERPSFGDRISRSVQRRVRDRAHGAMAATLGWAPRVRAADIVSAAAPYLRPEMWGEAVLTIGLPRLEWQHGRIDAAVIVGPFECLPTKIAQSQHCHLGEQEGLLTLTIPMNGDPVPAETLDTFAFEVLQHQRASHHEPHTPRRSAAAKPAGHRA